MINSYPKLTELDCGVLPDGLTFAQIHRLHFLETLSISGVEKHCDQLFAALNGSDHLTKLTIVNIALSPAAVQSLEHCSNLKELHLVLPRKDSKAQFDQIAPVANLKRIETLQLQYFNFNSETAGQLAKFQNLKQLKCHTDDDITQADIMALRQSLPNTEIWLIWRPANNSKTKPQQAPLGATEDGLQEEAHYRPLKKQAAVPSS